MRCCVPNCKNDSRHISKSQGITFHVFPNESSLRTAWLKALGKETWEPKDRSAICSEHFLCEDLYETRSGLRKVRAGAVPYIVQDSTICDDGQPASSKACRICLVMETKLIPIKMYKLHQAYETLTGISLEEEDKLPQKLCVECAQRLQNCINFRHKCLRANSLMLEVIKKQNSLTVQNIKTINRENNLLSSTLSIKDIDVNNFDSILPSPLQETLNVDIKQEHQIYFMEEEEQPGNDEPDQNVPNEDEIEKESVQSEKEYDIFSEKDDYSSDDIYKPFKKSKARKAKKKKKKPVKRLKKKKDPAEPKIDRRRKPFMNEFFNETLFTITDLTVDEQIEDIVKRRESSNYKNAVFKCMVCFKGFLDENAYNSHLTRHTDQCGEHVCEICKSHFKHPHALRKHITAHHMQRFSCNLCPYVTTHRQTARLHERWHMGTKYKCPHCQDEFVKFTTYMGHVRIKHPSDFVCEVCGYSFVSAKGIELHKKLKHRLDSAQVPEDGPLCELCNVRFVSIEAHKTHLSVSLRHSTGTGKGSREPNKPLQMKKAKESKDLERRERENEEGDEESDKRVYPSQMRKAEGPIPCEQCGLQLKDSRAYHGHFRRMHPDKNRTKYPSMKSPCMCEVCGKMFQSHALLKDHTWVHTGERPFACEACGKAFRMKQRLVAHRRVHSAPRASYACALCGKHFSTHSNRQRHMFIHTGLKPFKCEMCGKGFKHGSEKRAHIKYVHLKKPWPKRAREKRKPETRQQGQPAPQQGPNNDLEMAPQMWAPIDPKLSDINAIIEDPKLKFIII